MFFEREEVEKPLARGSHDVGLSDNQRDECCRRPTPLCTEMHVVHDKHSRVRRKCRDSCDGLSIRQLGTACETSHTSHPMLLRRLFFILQIL
jgi:hypothetical protein